MKCLNFLLFLGLLISGLIFSKDSFGDGGGNGGGLVSSREDNEGSPSIGGSQSDDKPDSSGATWGDSAKGDRGTKTSESSGGDSSKLEDHVIPMALSGMQNSQKRVIPVQLRLMLARIAGEAEPKQQK